MPGGTLEFGEEIEETLIREVKEETNLEIIETKLFTSDKIIIGDTHWLGLYFYCKIKDEKNLLNIEPEKHEKVEFVNIKNLPKMKNLEIIKKFLSENNF